MLIEIKGHCVLNTDHIIKIELCSNMEEKNLIVFHHVFNTETKATKINFEEEKMRTEFFDKVLKDYEEGKKISRWQI